LHHNIVLVVNNEEKIENENEERGKRRKEEKQAVLRLQVIEEILNSEVVYLEQVETLAQVCFKPFRAKNVQKLVTITIIS